MKKFYTILLYSAFANRADGQMQPIPAVSNVNLIGCVENEQCAGNVDSSVYLCSEKYDTLNAAQSTCHQSDLCDLILEVGNENSLHYEIATTKRWCEFVGVDFSVRHETGETTKESPGRVRRSSEPAMLCAKLSGGLMASWTGKCLHQFGSKAAAELACSIDETCNFVAKSGDQAYQLINNGPPNHVDPEKSSNFSKYSTAAVC